MMLAGAYEHGACRSGAEAADNNAPRTAQKTTRTVLKLPGLVSSSALNLIPPCVTVSKATTPAVRSFTGHRDDERHHDKQRGNKAERRRRPGNPRAERWREGEE